MFHFSVTLLSATTETHKYMKQNDNTKKQDETPKINNGLKSLILRYDGVQDWYIKPVNEYIFEKHKVFFAKGDISKIVNDKKQMSPRWLPIKAAVEYVVTDWGRKINALSQTESLISTPAGVVVVNSISKTRLVEA